MTSGRPAVTSRPQIEQIALDLFTDRGFEATTVDDIAAAAGIGRRTFFRYFASKNDVVWGEFEAGLEELRERLEATPANTPLLAGLRSAVLSFNRLTPAQVQPHRERMSLILTVPALQAHSTLMYAAWRAVIAEHAARRLDQDPEDLLPQVIAHTCLGAALTAYEQWLREPGSSLATLLVQAMTALDGTWTRL